MQQDDDESVDGPEGHALWARADRVLPGGAIYVSRSADFAGRGNLPGFIASAEGPFVTDVDGRRYIDFLCANGPMLLGYRHPEVEAAAARQQALGDSMSFYSPTLIAWIERLLEQFPGFAWGLVGKNGSDMVALALRVARVATERAMVVTFDRAWHGFDAELAARPDRAPDDRQAHLRRLPWNDVAALEHWFEEWGERTAAILLNPLDQALLHSTRSLSAPMAEALARMRTTYGCLIILDDVRHGLRLHAQGSHHVCALDPDLLCVGKAIGNGFATAGLLGRSAQRSAAAKIPFTASFAFGATACAAGIATLDVYARDQALARMERAGARLVDGLRRAAEAAGHGVEISGPATMPTLRFEGESSFSRGQCFVREAARRGVLFHPALNWFLSAAHDDAVIDEAIAVAADAFARTPLLETMRRA
ncbi:MAG: aminotransferase class III-fold pyridoxal phosphate-dependent enzyme [Pseudomonadales bacterium]|jgi:glutamate-1-semialdehyde 2,1-aminomutase|nr:aminotransferase class III-fold pyridoxal phosphate-dependent enzyme [Pseudomonadales bacterium]